MACGWGVPEVCSRKEVGGRRDAHGELGAQRGSKGPGAARGDSASIGSMVWRAATCLAWCQTHVP